MCNSPFSLAPTIRVVNLTQVRLPGILPKKLLYPRKTYGKA